MACDRSPKTAGDNLHSAALLRPEIRHGGFADEAQVTLAKFRRGHLVIHQSAADDDDARVQSHGQIGDEQTHDARLKIKNLHGQQIAFLRAGVRSESAFCFGVSVDLASSWSGYFQ